MPSAVAKGPRLDGRRGHHEPPARLIELTKDDIKKSGMLARLSATSGTAIFTSHRCSATMTRSATMEI
ncbi:hypothetical protein PG987_016598 [Apiospora arundinis]